MVVSKVTKLNFSYVMLVYLNWWLCFRYLILRLYVIDFSLVGSSGCFDKESWCEAAKPDCSTSLARESCKKYCGLCQISSCVNKESWCEAAKPDCSTSLARESCKKFCGLCGGGKIKIKLKSLILYIKERQSAVVTIWFNFQLLLNLKAHLRVVQPGQTHFMDAHMISMMIGIRRNGEL